MIGEHSVIVTPPGGGFPPPLGLDISCNVDQVSIVHGRADSTSQPAPAAATIDVTVSPSTPLPDALDIGALLTVETQLQPPPPSPNLQADSSFETGITGWGYSLASVVHDPAVAQPDYGTHSSRMTCTAAGKPYMYTTPSNRPPIVGGMTYVNTAWVLSPSRRIDVSMILYGYDLAGAGTGSVTRITTVEAGVWTRVQGTPLTMPANAATARTTVMMNAAEVGDVLYVDNVQLEEATTPTPYQPRQAELPPVDVGPFRRFTGRVTDIALGWDDAGEDTPNRGVGQIVAVSVLADYARSVIGEDPFPQELDGARVARVFDAAGLAIDADPGTVEVIARDIDPRAALEVAQGTADSAGGLVWETTDGTIRYADSEHRRGATTALTLDACDLLVTPTWTRDLGGLVNELTMAYGEPPDGGGDRPVLYLDNATSRDRWGRYAYSVATELATAPDAASAASLLLAQNSGPVWLLSALPVDVAGLSLADTATLLHLDVHALLELTGLPYAGSAPRAAHAWVEGWTERLAWGVHDLELTVSDYCRTAPPPRWDDIPPGLSWDAAVGTWDAWSCWGPAEVPPTAERRKPRRTADLVAV